jgi:hypothetical protein
VIRLITGWLILATVAIWIAWDVYAYVNGTNSTISVVITDWSREIPAIGVIVGIVIGHWFFGARGSEDK